MRLAAHLERGSDRPWAITSQNCRRGGSPGKQAHQHGRAPPPDDLLPSECGLSRHNRALTAVDPMWNPQVSKTWLGPLPEV